MNGALLAGLSDEQRAAVTSERSPLCILAGAGSGKTAVLSRRIAWRVADGTAEPGHVLALTFTSKAATELAGRLHGLGMRPGATTGTFHSVALAQLRRRWSDASRRPAAVLRDRVGFLRRVLEVSGAGPESSPRYLDDASAELSAEISWAKARSLDPRAYAHKAPLENRAPMLLTTTTVADLYESYERRKRRRGVVDFDDLVEMCASAIEEDPLFGAAQRWRFRHLFVDEAQDLNPAQWRLLGAWAGGAEDVCVVGDPRQAIYGWNGADPELLEQFAARRSTTVVHLRDNWRCTPQILSCATTALEGPAAECGVVHARSWSAHPRPRPARTDSGPLPTVTAYTDERAEARGVASLLADVVGRGHSYEDCAVLARTNGQLVPLREALGAAGVPLGQDGEAGVDLLTFHRSKGLEWPVVVLAGMADGLVPLASARGRALAEERRLVYVAMTRAATELHCTWSAGGRLDEERPGQCRPRPSPFVSHLGAGPIACEPTSPAPTVQSRLDELRHRLQVSPGTRLTEPAAGATTGL